MRIRLAAMFAVVAATATVASLASLGGCSGLWWGPCTLIGCRSGLRVHLVATPADPFRVELRTGSPTAQPAWVYDCPSPTLCTDPPEGVAIISPGGVQRGIFFPDFSGDHAFVTVVTGTSRRTTEVTAIEYHVSRPNGPHCPPACRNARITVDAAK